MDYDKLRNETSLNIRIYRKTQDYVHSARYNNMYLYYDIII